MLSKGKMLRCTANRAHDEFTASAHVVELWKVNDVADFVSVVETTETTCAPGDDGVYFCAMCESQAKVITITQPRECADCGRIWNKDELDEIDKLYERVEEGKTMPSGQCPNCGALCLIPNWHNVKEEP